LSRTRIDPPKKGLEVSLRKALASSYNQCFAQLAVHVVGGAPLMDAISRFGWLSAPAPAHPPGSADLGEDLYDIGKLGCGLAGSQITPLHAAQLAATLAKGELVAPHWIEAVYDPDGRELPIPAAPAPRQVITSELAAELRSMLTDTTLRGTARRAFRKRNGRPLLGPVEVAGKTGSLSGTNPKGRYEWFAGVAPADQPRIAVAVLVVQTDLWWRNASQIAAEVLQGVFCEGRDCRPELAARWIRIPTATAATLGHDAEAMN
jgi:cell division protein FtsI/penicillin-binding protein 2